MSNAKKDINSDDISITNVHSCDSSRVWDDSDDTSPNVLCGATYAKKEELLQKYFQLKPALRETILSQLLTHIDTKLLQDTIIEIDKHL